MLLRRIQKTRSRVKAKLAPSEPRYERDEKGRGGGGGGNPKFILNSVKSISKYQIRKVHIKTIVLMPITTYLGPFSKKS